MKNTKIVAASAAALLSLGLVAAPVASANAQPPGPGNPGHGLSVDRSTWREARQALKEALMAAREQFHVDMKAAIETLKADTADEREALKSVVTDPEATDEQKAAAREQWTDLAGTMVPVSWPSGVLPSSCAQVCMGSTTMGVCKAMSHAE